MELLKTFIDTAKAEHAVLIDHLARRTDIDASPQARLAFVDRLVGETKSRVKISMRYSELEQYLSSLHVKDLVAFAVAVDGPNGAKREIAKLTRVQAPHNAPATTAGGIDQMPQPEAVVVDGWLASISTAFHLCKAHGQTHDAEKLFEVLRYLGSAPAALTAPEIVVEMEGGVITVVDSNVPVTVTFLDADTEGGDEENIATVDGSEFYVSVHAVTAEQCRLDYVQRVADDVATHLQSSQADTPSPT